MYLSNPRETTSARGACYAPPDYENWSKSAIEQELGELATMTMHNIYKPASPFWIHLLKIASIVKGCKISQSETFIAIETICKRFDWLKIREVEYQWQRALKTAVPRKPEVIYQYDLKNGRTHSERIIPDKTVTKAEKLAVAITILLETGELPELQNVTIRQISDDKNGITLNLHFARYSPSLADCVQICCSRLQGFIWDDLQTGVFRIWVRTRTL